MPLKIGDPVLHSLDTKRLFDDQSSFVMESGDSGVFFVKSFLELECTCMDEKESRSHELFLMLFTANEPAIRAYVRRLVPTREDAGDVMQGIALVLWRKFEELQDPNGFRPWAFGIARYEVLGWRRDKARNRLVLAEDILEVVAKESSHQESRLDAQRGALADCLEKLPDDQRELVLAAYQPDASIQNVADRSGRTVAAFYQWLHRIRGRLLECTHRVLKAEGQS